jgi:hypothetical protein
MDSTLVLYSLGIYVALVWVFYWFAFMLCLAEDTRPVGPFDAAMYLGPMILVLVGVQLMWQFVAWHRRQPGTKGCLNIQL